jgi:sugar lactone lactonase YvrE
MSEKALTFRGLAVLLALVFGAGACGGGDDRQAAGDDPAAAADTAAPAGPSARPLATVDSLEGPEAVRWDPDQQVWFVSNVNGGPGAKDNNGYISRLTPEGRIDSLKFIAGGRGGVTLHAPKGLAIVGDTLWVADIDVVRGFNRRTGKLVSNVRVPGSKFLNDIATGPDGIYVTDTGVEFTADGQAKHPGPDAIYKIAGRRATTAVTFEGQPGPNGITWDSAGSRFIIVPFQDKAISAWTPGDSTPQKIGEGPGMQDGIEAFGAGRFLVTAWADSSLSILSEGKMTRLAGDLPGAADIGYDRESGRVAVPHLTEDKVTILQIDVGQ